MSKTYVLVHGAWHGGWCWRRVADRLTARGHRVFAPTLTGVADRSHLYTPEVDLQTHVTDIVNLMKWEDLSDVVLVGHSYGGMVISGVAEQMESAIASIVYLDAFVPESGQGLADLAMPGQAEALRAQALSGNPVPPIAAATFKVNEADQAWVDAKCTPHPPRCFVQGLPLTGAYQRIGRKHFIMAGAHGRFARFRDKLLGDPAWSCHELPCGHDIMVDMPEELAGLLEAA